MNKFSLSCAPQERSRFDDSYSRFSQLIQQLESFVDAYLSVILEQKTSTLEALRLLEKCAQWTRLQVHALVLRTVYSVQYESICTRQMSCLPELSFFSSIPLFD